MKIADLFAEVGFKFDSVKLKDLGKILGDINLSSVLGVTSLVGLGLEVKKLIQDTTKLSSNLETISANTGINPEFTQRFANASKSLGASKEEAEQFLSTLSQKQFEIANGQGGEYAFIRTWLLGEGVTPDEIIGDTEKLALKINDILSKASTSTDPVSSERRQRFLADLSRNFGASPDMNKVLQNVRLQEKMLEFSVLNVEEIKKARAAQEAWFTVVENFNVELGKVTTDILPAMTEALKEFTQGEGFKDLYDFLKIAGQLAGGAIQYAGIGAKFVKSAAMDAQSLSQKVFGNMDFGDFGRNLGIGKRQSKQQTNHLTVHVHVQNPVDSVHAVEALWSNYFKNADAYFGQQ